VLKNKLAHEIVISRCKREQYQQATTEKELYNIHVVLDSEERIGQKEWIFLFLCLISMIITTIFDDPDSVLDDAI